MHPRATELIATLALAAHPEGGYFREIYRSASAVQRLDPLARRTALTTIYFLLTAPDVSRWHRVASDEAWHFYEGDTLELLVASADLKRVERRTLGPARGATQAVHVVPAGAWQAARPLGAYTLAGCTVGPGFEFEDFTMLRDGPARVGFAQAHPDVADLI
jgi:predicted cupin superfamily sugar epimerase